jgi:hypothetical protein
MPGLEPGDTGMGAVYSYCELRIRCGATSGLCDVHVMFLLSIYLVYTCYLLRHSVASCYRNIVL